MTGSTLVSDKEHNKTEERPLGLHLCSRDAIAREVRPLLAPHLLSQTPLLGQCSPALGVYRPSRNGWRSALGAFLLAEIMLARRGRDVVESVSVRLLQLQGARSPLPCPPMHLFSRRVVVVAARRQVMTNMPDGA